MFAGGDDPDAAILGTTEGGGVEVEGVSGFSLLLKVAADAPVEILLAADAFVAVRFDDEPVILLAANVC